MSGSCPTEPAKGKRTNFACVERVDGREAARQRFCGFLRQVLPIRVLSDVSIERRRQEQVLSEVDLEAREAKA